MIRYVKQRNMHTCGPIVIINVMKFLGISASLGDVKRIKKLCKTNTQYGTLVADFDRAIRLLVAENATVRHIKRRKLSTVKKSLKRGLAVAILYVTPTGGHFAMLTEKDRFTINEINSGYDRPTVMDMSYEELKYVLSFPSEIWIISKK
jgi:hypothetical protein